MIRHFLRRHPAIRLRAKLWLLDVLMMLAALEADDDRLPARERMAYGRRVMQFIRWHQRLSALRGVRP